MFKKSFFTLMFVAALSYVSAQTLQFELNGQVFEDGQTVYCIDYNPDYGEFIQEMQLRNISNDDLNVIVEREIIDIPEGGSAFFCWGNCFSPSVSVSNAEPMPAGSVSGVGALSFHYLPANLTDIAFIKYYAYDVRHDNERVSVVIAYNTAEGVAEKPAGNLSHAYPNPASTIVRFNYELTTTDNASLKVYNLLGQEVMNQQLSCQQGYVSISVASLNEGIYFCNLIVNGQAMKTEKFIVRK